MYEEAQKELAKFFVELQRESDRGLALIGASLIDEKLSQTLRTFFCNKRAAQRLLDHGTAPLGTFSARVDACLALGLIDDNEYREINRIRKVRNEFAHSIHGTQFGTEKIRSLCFALESDLPTGADLPIDHPRFRYTNAIVAIVSGLYFRPESVEKHKRKPKTWVDRRKMRWRSIDEEEPPQGVPFVAIGKLNKDNKR